MHKRNLGNLLLYVFCVIGPIVIIIYSTKHAFPSSLVIIAAMMVITAGVAGVCTYFANDAMPYVRTYCTRLNLILGIVGCFNLYGHLAMSRELSSAEQNVAELHAEEDRQMKRKNEDAQIEIAKKEAEARVLRAETGLSNAERARLIHLPFSERHSLVRPRPAKAAEPEKQASTSSTSPEENGVRSVETSITPAQVRESWSWWFIIFSFVEACVAVVGGLGIKVNWAWDQNHNGIDDAVEERQRQQSKRQPISMSPSMPGTAQARHPKA